MKDSKVMKEILAKNLDLQLTKKGSNQTDMARELNFPETTVSNWMKAETYPRPDRLQMMADYFNISRSELTEQKASNIIRVSQRTVDIPILGPIACGDPILVEANYEEYRTELVDGLPSGNLVYLQAKGDSMEPTIPDGSHVLIREQSEVEYGEIAAVLVNGDTEVTLKKVTRQGDTVLLMPINSAHEPIIITQDNPARIIGKAIRYTQEL